MYIVSTIYLFLCIIKPPSCYETIIFKKSHFVSMLIARLFSLLPSSLVVWNFILVIIIIIIIGIGMGDEDHPPSRRSSDNLCSQQSKCLLSAVG